MDVEKNITWKLGKYSSSRILRLLGRNQTVKRERDLGKKININKKKIVGDEYQVVQTLIHP